MPDGLHPLPGAPRIRVLARTADWSVAEHICDATPADPVFEEAHDGVTIAAVASGVFTYRTENAKALLHPGALLLGNDRQCFECGHEHGSGDRCVSISYTPAFFAEIAASVAGTSHYRFAASMLPPLPRLLALTTQLDVLAAGASAASEDAIIALAEAVIATASGQQATAQPPSAGDERRVAAVLRYIETHHSDPLDLGQLAGIRRDALSVPVGAADAQGRAPRRGDVRADLEHRVRRRFRRSVDLQPPLSAPVPQQPLGVQAPARLAPTATCCAAAGGPDR